jgi:hypothetical protein
MQSAVAQSKTRATMEKVTVALALVVAQAKRATLIR